MAVLVQRKLTNGEAEEEIPHIVGQIEVKMIVFRQRY